MVTGAPASGKTTLAHRLAAALHLPLICKDDIKEHLYDDLGTKDLSWARQLGRASFNLLYYLIECQLCAAKPVIVEANFSEPFASQHFGAFQTEYNFDLLQIYCWAPAEVLFERYQQRAQMGVRHPGHIGQLSLEELATHIRQHSYRIALQSSLIEVDTTDFAVVDYDQVIEMVKSAYRPN